MFGPSGISVGDSAAGLGCARARPFPRPLSTTMRVQLCTPRRKLTRQGEELKDGVVRTVYSSGNISVVTEQSGRIVITVLRTEML